MCIWFNDMHITLAKIKVTWGLGSKEEHYHLSQLLAATLA